jgi:hypothetical protein
LRRIVDDDCVAVPGGDRGEQPERVVRVLGGGVDGLVHDVGRREPRVDVAAHRVVPEWVRHELAALVTQLEDGLAGIVGHGDQPRGLVGLLRRVRHDDGDVLPVVQDAVVLQRRGRRKAERAGGCAAQARRVEVGDDRLHAVDRRCGVDVDLEDSPCGDRAAYERGVRHVGEGDVGRVGRRSGDLQGPVDAIDGSA